MIKLVRTNSKNKDFIDLVKLLDADLAIRDGEDHDFYNQFNKLDSIKHTVVLYENEIPLGCGAIKEFESNIMEVKRMFTLPKSRGKGIASQILTELENWAKELNFKKLILETGVNQPEAIALYEKSGFKRISNYGQYAGVENSFCFEKILD
ncbi:GNAT family N-acetyltransferase [Aureibaculum sp. 2210JD6-5]|uniref:GNAT family N-acetyltransferase n=1 Tax=Aureibaculum sp. 2210JD6-5 TaxID=3103957 RepID=UPI002AAC4DF0|nr:GNAT family N-acetyltransferase [Aureibaculum sp. 2210JD6-5]MDY7395432.1 GNAT family N-acetyltransferase [Aureibaculum sp. 2210JD6-5]